MTKYLALLALVSAVLLSACGVKHTTTTSAVVQQQEQAAVSTADQAVQRCLPVKDGAPDVLVLRSHAKRQAFMNCAVPPAKRAAFDACLTKVALGGLPTKTRLKTGAIACLNKVGA